MTYAPPNRAFHDADSHIMELPDFLRPDDVRDNFYAESVLRIFPDARVH